MVSPMHFLSDFAHIPETIDAYAKSPLPSEALDLLKSRNDKAGRVRLVGMGGSFNAATAAAEQFLKLGIDARAELASHLLHSSAKTVGSDELIVLISYSGTSIETIRAAEELRKGARPRIICITNAQSGPLVSLCDVVLRQGLNETTHKPFGPWTATYLTLVKLAHAMVGQQFKAATGLKEECGRLLAAAESLIALQPSLPMYIEFFGRGALAATATQATLIAREIARVPASDWDSSTYRHGPIEAISSTQLSVIFAARDGRQAGLDSSFVAAMKGIVNKVLVVGPEGSEMPVRVDEILLPLVSLFLPAILSYAWSEKAGLTAGEFRYTSHSITDEEVLSNDG